MQPLSILEALWESVSMDFMVSLPPSWWWWINLARWHTSFPPRKMPWPKRREACSSRTCSSIMASQRTLCRIETQSSQVLASFVEVHGVTTQNEHLIPTPNKWTNQQSELSYPLILTELCGNRSRRLGPPFGVGRILLQQFGTFGN